MPGQVTEQKKPSVSQADVEALFGETTLFSDKNQNAMHYLQERAKINNEMNKVADSFRNDMENEQKLRDALDELKLVSDTDGSGKATRLAIGKIIGSIPGLKGLRKHFDPAALQDVLKVLLADYRQQRNGLARLLGEEPADGFSIPKYIEEVRELRDQCLAKLKDFASQVTELEKQTLSAKDDVRKVALSFLPELAPRYMNQDVKTLNIAELRKEAREQAPDPTTQKGIQFRDQFQAAVRKFEDLQQALIEASEGVNQYSALLDFHTFEEDEWIQLRDSAQRTYHIVQSTIEDRERLVKAIVQSNVAGTIIAQAIRRGEQIKEATSEFAYHNTKMNEQVAKAARTATMDIIEKKRLAECQAIVDGLKKDKDQKQVVEYKNAKEVLARGIPEKPVDTRQ